MSDFKVTADITDLQLMRRELLGVTKDAKASASVFDREFNKVERALTSAAKASQLHYRETLKIDLAHKKAAQSAAVMERELRKQEAATKAQAREVERLSNKYKPLYAASKQYERALDELAAAHSLGVISTKQHENAIESLSAEYQQFQAGSAGWSNQFVQGSNMAGKSANRMGMATQQAGYQVGDFIVQVQSGANPFVAFGQQATQLVGVMGMMNPALIGVGAALGIIIPLMTAVGAAFYTSHKTAKEAAEGANKFEDALKSARSEVQGMKDDLRLLQSGFKNTFELTLSDAIDNAKVELEEAREALQNVSVGPNGQVNVNDLYKAQAQEEARQAVHLAQLKLAGAQELLRQSEALERSDSVRNQLHEVRQQLAEAAREKAEQEANELSNVNRELQLSIDLRRASMDHTKESMEYLEVTQAHERAILEERIKTEEISAELAGRLRDSLSLAQTFAQVDMAAVVRSAADETTLLIERLTKAVGLAAIMDTVNSGPQYSGRGNSQGAGSNATDRFMLSQGGELTVPANSTTKPSANTGGSSAKPQLTLDQLEKQTLAVAKLAANLTMEGDILRQIQTIEKDLGDTRGQYSEEAIRQSAELIVAKEAERASIADTQKQQEDLANSIAQTMGNSLMSVVDGTKTTAEAFKDMAASIIKQLFEVMVVQKLVANLSSAMSGSGAAASAVKAIVASADGNVISSGSVVPYAKGGVVSSATMFPMSGNKTGLMGEAGPEAIMPLSRGSDGKLGVKTNGGSPEQNIVVNQSFNFQSNGDETIKSLIAQAAPKIAQMTKSSLLDDRRRGGATKRAFG